MPVTLTASALRPDVVRADLLVVPAGPDGPLGTAARALRPIGPTLRAVVTATGFEGKPGQTALVPAGDALGVPAVLLVGVGDPAAVAVDGAEFVFLCVGTPQGDDGRADLVYYTPGDGYWHFRYSNGGTESAGRWGWGGSKSVPVAGQFDHD